MLIIKLGGSVVQNSLTEMNPQIFEFISKIQKFDTKIVLTVGGGKISRLFQNTLRENGIIERLSLDEVGSRAVNLQAEYVKQMFPRNKTFPRVMDSKRDINLAQKSLYKYNYFVCGATAFGDSSDYDAALTAKIFKQKTLIRISNIDYVYDKDPRYNKDAKSFKELSWDEYLEIIGKDAEFIPGGSYPVDPVCARFAKEHNIRFYFSSLTNFLEKNIIDLNNWEGSIIG